MSSRACVGPKCIQGRVGRERRSSGARRNRATARGSSDPRQAVVNDASRAPPCAYLGRVFGGSFLQATEVSRTCRGRGIESRTQENTDRKQFSVKLIYVMHREHSSREGNLDARLEADCHTIRIRVRRGMPWRLDIYRIVPVHECIRCPCLCQVAWQSQLEQRA